MERKLTIGGITLANPVILAPMAGVSDLPFRLLCKEQGAGLVCMEMVSAKAICYRNKNTENMMEIHPQEQPVSLQLFGSDPAVMGEAAKRIAERPFSILDINMGCPVPKVVNNKEGSALMKNPKLAGEIVSSVVKAVKKPVTVKIRKGFDEEHANAPEIAKIAEAAGAAAIIVHGRTRQQYYAGDADWDSIRMVKEAVRIPVIGNGDVKTPADAADMLAKTGCDGVMIARAARGNPWLFCQTAAYLAGESMPKKPSREEMYRMVMRHAKLQFQYKGEYTGIREMRKHVAWYTAGLPNAAKLRGEIHALETMAQLEEMARWIFLQEKY